MKSQLYIPKKLKIGYQKRAGTFTGKLAYVIYYDDKNVLRKEKSWESWRHKDIEPNEFDNAPMSGFVINKDVSRYNWGHFSSNKSYIRIHDPRGFEFEISPENLIGILMNGDCSRRTLIGDFVYSWHGTDLVLLPCNSEEYQSSTKFTALQGKKIGVKDLVPGCAYRTKKEGTVIYMGKFNWYEFKGFTPKGEVMRRWPNNAEYDGGVWKQMPEKRHIFYVGSSFQPKTSLEFLAEQINPESVSNYASLMDKFNDLRKSSKIVELFGKPVPFDPQGKKQFNYYNDLENAEYFVEEDGYFMHLEFRPVMLPYDHEQKKNPRKPDAFRHKYEGTKKGLKLQGDDIITKYKDESDRYRSYRMKSEAKEFSEAQLNAMSLLHLYARLENGKTVRLEDWTSFLQ